MIGQSVRAGGIPMTGSMRLIERARCGDRARCRACAPRKLRAAAAEAAPAAEAAAGAEPEVIKKGKKEEEEAERPRRARRSSRSMFLVVGLGNPGEEYADTPHNRASWWSTGWRRCTASASTARIRRRWRAWARSPAKPVMLAKPQTFMNLSGDVGGAADGKAWIDRRPI